MATKDKYHVIPDDGGGWNVLRSGSSRASRHLATKREAVKHGRMLAKQDRIVLVIHNGDGTVARVLSYQQRPPAHTG